MNYKKFFTSTLTKKKWPEFRLVSLLREKIFVPEDLKINDFSS